MTFTRTARCFATIRYRNKQSIASFAFHPLDLPKSVVPNSHMKVIRIISAAPPPPSVRIQQRSLPRQKRPGGSTCVTCSTRCPHSPPTDPADYNGRLTARSNLNADSTAGAKSRKSHPPCSTECDPDCPGTGSAESALPCQGYSCHCSG